MNKKNDKKSKNIFLRIGFISGLFLVVLILLSVVLNIYFQPKTDILIHADKSKNSIVKEIESFTLDDEIMNKFRVVEVKYGVLIESVMPDGSISYTTFADEIYVDKKFENSITDNDIKSTKPIDREIQYEEKNLNDVLVYDFKRVQINNTKSEYYLYETVLKESDFQVGNTLRIYFATYGYQTTLRESGVNRVFINGIVLVLAWTILMIVLMVTYIKIQRLNLSIKRMEKEMLNPECEELCPVDASEVGRLGKNINDMVRESRKNFISITEENKKLSDKLEMKERMEDDKKDFLANTAHELKTPISIVRGCAEGLKLGIAKGGRARQKYCDTIIDESEKMNKLVLELLDLSKYNQKMYEDVVEENFSIRSFIQAELKAMESIFKENSITVENTIERTFIGRTDIEKQALVFRNYIKNAISHVDMYKKIVISCEEKPNAYRIKVFNSGEKISESEKNKIWDSFYRVDKSHGRSEGRFGIGLQIVASIQEVLKMDYGVKNVHGGVQFWFDVKKASKD